MIEVMEVNNNTKKRLYRTENGDAKIFQFIHHVAAQAAASTVKSIDHSHQETASIGFQFSSRLLLPIHSLNDSRNPSYLLFQPSLPHHNHLFTHKSKITSYSH